MYLQSVSVCKAHILRPPLGLVGPVVASVGKQDLLVLSHEGGFRVSGMSQQMDVLELFACLHQFIHVWVRYKTVPLIVLQQTGLVCTRKPSCFATCHLLLVTHRPYTLRQHTTTWQGSALTQRGEEVLQASRHAMYITHWQTLLKVFTRHQLTQYKQICNFVR